MTKHTAESRLAYVAGLVDGEGSFWIAETKTSMSLNLQVKMGHRKVIEFAHRVLGGAIYTYDSRYASYVSPTGRTKNPQYGCRLTGRQVVVASELLLPYLVVKREQAKLAIRFGATIGQPGLRLTDRQQQVRKDCLSTMKLLNGRMS